MVLLSMLLLVLTTTLSNYVKSLEDLEFMENTGAMVIDQNNNEETSLLSELLGRPVGDASTAEAKSTTAPKYSKMKINCHHMSQGTSENRKKLLYAVCPTLRQKHYEKHANRVAKVLENQYTSKKSLDEQKKDFLNAVSEMAKAAGHLPQLEFH